MGRRIAGALLGLGLGLAPACAMAAMGYGGYGGGGGNNMGSSMQLDDYMLALRDLHAEKYADAIPHLERALAARPDSADIMGKLGFANAKTGNYQLAYGWLKKALSKDPDNKIAHENLGELYLLANDQASALGQLAELARLCPDTCEERESLTKAVADYQAAHPATPSAAPAAPPK
jgi:tetratricopeptide (TPR) repeat protein